MNEIYTSNIFSANIEAFQQKKRYIINQGGTRSGKTYSILQMLLLIAMKSQNQLIISVVSSSFPHLRMGAIRDFKTICYSMGVDFEKHYNRSTFTFQYNNATIEFFSSDNLGKVHGPARDYLFLNECNFIKQDIFDHLNIRTRKTVILDFNPIRRFWVHNELVNKGNAILIKSTYRDNPNLDPMQVQAIEEKKHEENWWRIYGQGEVGFDESILFNEITMKRYENIDISRADHRLCYVDTADTGKDFFCAVLGAVFQKKVYIFDVIFQNSRSLGEYEAILVEKLKENKVNKCVIETNREGSYFAQKVREQVETKIIGVFNKQHKETRILLQAANINDNFYFQNNLNTEMKNYFQQLTSYSMQEKNEHDDAADATAGLSKLCKNYYGL